MNNATIVITLIEDAADVIMHARTKQKLIEELEKVFQDKGIVVSIDVNEPIREESTTSEPGVSEAEISDNQ